MTRSLGCSLGAALLAASVGCGTSTQGAPAQDAGARDATAPFDASLAGYDAGDDAAVSDAASDAGAIDAAPEDAGPLPYTVLASGQGLPSGIAVDDAGVYWIDLGEATGHGKAQGPYVDGGVMACAKTGCPSGPTTLASGLTQILFVASPAPIVVAGGTVYFGAVDGPTYAGVIQTCATTGCGGAPATFAAEPTWGLTTNGTSLVWSEGSASLIESCPLAGCDAGPTVIYAPAADAGYPLAYGVAADSTAAYWLGPGVDGNLYSCPLSGCGAAPATLGITTPEYAQIVTSAGNLVFTNTDPIGLGGIFSCPKTGCAGAPTAIAPGRSSPVGLAVDDTRVYWTEYGNGMGDGGVSVPNPGGVYACPLTGCGASPIVIADAQDAPTGIAVDDAHVYWVAQGANGGEVRSAPKP